MPVEDPDKEPPGWGWAAVWSPHDGRLLDAWRWEAHDLDEHARRLGHAACSKSLPRWAACGQVCLHSADGGPKVLVDPGNPISMHMRPPAGLPMCSARTIIASCAVPGHHQKVIGNEVGGSQAASASMPAFLSASAAISPCGGCMVVLLPDMPLQAESSARMHSSIDEPALALDDAAAAPEASKLIHYTLATGAIHEVLT